MSDPFLTYAPGLESPFSHAVAVTPSDTEDLPAVSRALFVRGYGDMTVVMAGGETVTFPGFGDSFGNGRVYHLRVSRILATGTRFRLADGDGRLQFVALW